MPSKKMFFASILRFVLVSLLFVGSVGASSELWSQTYGGEHGKVVYTFDSAYSLVETSDGGYALAGYTKNANIHVTEGWLVKTDATGDVMWNLTYGEGRFRSLVRTADGGFALAGSIGSSSAGNYDFWLVKTDEDGNLVWSQTYGGSENDVAYALVQTSDEGYALAGLTKSFGAGDDDLWLVKTDMYGNVEWNNTYGLGFEDNPSLVQTSDGGYALASCTTPFGGGASDWWLVKTDSNGDMEWNKIYGGKSVDRVYSLIETSDEGFALAGFFGYTITAQSWLVKTDANGDMEWNKTYSVGDFQALVETSDGGFALAAGEGLVKTDENGNTEWNQTYGGDEYDCFHALIETSDGGYALAGKTYSFAAGASDFWLVKTDAHGCIPEIHSPYICVDSPQNKTYTTDNVSLNFTVNEETSWMGYSLDGQDNVTITETSLNLTELADGSHTLTVYATDTDGNTAVSETLSFIIAKESEPEQPDYLNLILAVALMCIAIATVLGLLIYLKKS